MKVIKEKVQITSGAKMKKNIDMVITVMIAMGLPSIMTIALNNIIGGLLPNVDDKVSLAIATVIGVLMIGIGAITTLKTFKYNQIRLYTYSYLENVYDQISKSHKFEENGKEYVRCPRCGSKMQIKKKTSMVNTKVGERITENMQGEVISREPIYKASKRVSISYHCCNNECALDVHDSLPSWKSAPCSVARARLLILGEKPKNSKKLAAKEIQVSPVFIFYIIFFLVCMLLGYIQFQNYEKTKYGKYTDGADAVSKEEILSFLDTIDLSGEYLVTLEYEPSSMFEYLFGTAVNSKNEIYYDRDTGNWEMGGYYFIDNVMYGVTYDTTNKKYDVKTYDSINDQVYVRERTQIVNSALISNILSIDSITEIKRCLTEDDTDELSLLKKDNMIIINYVIYFDSQYQGDYYFIFENNKLVCTRAKLDNSYYQVEYTYQDIDNIVLPAGAKIS